MMRSEEEELTLVQWKRGKKIGRGSFGSVYTATTNDPELPVMAVKSAQISHSRSLRKEKQLLDCLQDCPNIVQCYGDNVSFENGHNFYNLFLEYASAGDLSHRILTRGRDGLPEYEIKRYTRSILQGLEYMHSKNYVHCDIKPQNILLFDDPSSGDSDAKIADFGVAIKRGELDSGDEEYEFRGTADFLAPECILHKEYEPCCDIWALGCCVVEMFTGEPAWQFSPSTRGSMEEMFRQISSDTHELPMLPIEASKEAKDFVAKCLVRVPLFRWTARLLLNHPFIREDHHVIIDVL